MNWSRPETVTHLVPWSMAGAQRHEAQGVEPVVEGHHQHLLLQPPGGAVLLRPVAARDEAPAVDEDHDGEEAVGLHDGGIDVEVEAVLLSQEIPRDSLAELRTHDLSVATEVKDRGPCVGRLGRQQPQ